MSDGMTMASGELAFASGANTWLNRIPVMFVNRKTEMTAKGANLSERNTGILRGNFIN
jgi:hypothetical protein